MVDIVKFVLRFFSKCFSLLRCNILKNSVGRNRQLTEAVVYIAYVFHADETRLTSFSFDGFVCKFSLSFTRERFGISWAILGALSPCTLWESGWSRRNMYALINVIEIYSKVAVVILNRRKIRMSYLWFEISFGFLKHGQPTSCS